MVNKKGFIRTLEAVIAILLILGFIFYITPKTVGLEEKVPENVVNAKEFILNQILLNKEYRQCIFGANVVNPVSNPFGNCEGALSEDCKNNIIPLFEYIPEGYEYACEICEDSGGSTRSCLSPTIIPEGRSIYTNTIFIYKTGNYNFMRIYIWKK